MKTMTKKMGAIVLALAMCFSLCCTALAAGDDDTGSITISGAVAGEEYSIYQMFYLTYATGENDEGQEVITSYSYVVPDDWIDFLTSDDYKDYFELTSIESTITYIDPSSEIFQMEDNSEFMAKFAQDALAYAKNNEIEPVATISFTYDAETGTVTPSEEGLTVSDVEVNKDTGVVTASLTIDGLDLGYYLVDTTLGSLCSLDTTAPDAVIREKNPTPYPEKEEKDDETDDEYTKEDTAEVGDVINYEVFLHDVAHSVNLCMHDTMTEGLTFDDASVKVYVGYPDPSIEDLFNDDTTEWTLLTKGTEYTENDSCGDGCAFELSFSDEWLDTLSSGAVIRVTYSAVVNENAIDENNLWAIQYNDVVLTYGSASTSEHGTTETDLVGFNIYKYTTQDGEVVGLDGAEFSLYRDSEHTDIVSFVPIYDGESIVGYEEVDPDDYTGNGIPTTTIEAGSVYVKGLHEGTYYLTETKAPDGYNMLTDDIIINIILTDNGDGTYTETVTVDGTPTDDQTARIENNQGSKLPGTGGIGTTIFYIIGGVLIVGAAVVLVTRRRMNSNEG